MIVRPRVPSSVAIAVTLSLALLPLADVLTAEIEALSETEVPS